MTAPSASEPNGPRRRRPFALAVLLLIALAAAFQGPRLGRPFGVAEINGGAYFGLFARTWQDWGFWKLRGMPLASQRLKAPEQGLPYLNHPPGVAWLCYLVGPEEAPMRAITTVAALGAVLAFLVLLQPLVGLLRATLAAATLLGVPSLTIYSQVSYETIVLALGLALWVSTLATERSHGSVRRRWMAVQALVAFCGVWADWSFVFFCAGLVPLVVRRSWRATARALAAPASAALLGALLVVAWRTWAAANPLFAGSGVDTSLGEMVRTTILERPPLLRWLELASHTMLAATTLPLLLLAIVGLPFLWRARPRLALAMLIAGTGQPLLFGNHATNHVHFYCYTNALLVAAAAGPLAAPRRWVRILGTIALAAVGAHAWTVSAGIVERSDTTFYRDLGEVLSEASAHPGHKAYRVATNFPATYPYYVESPDVLVSRETDPTVLMAARHNPQFPYGYRYLWVAAATGRSADWAIAPTQPRLEALFAPFEKTPVPKLERRIGEPRMGFEMSLQKVYLVDVPPDFTVLIAAAEADQERAHTLAEALAHRQRGLTFAHALPTTPAIAERAVSATPPAASHLVVLADAASPAGDGAHAGEHAAAIAAIDAANRHRVAVVVVGDLAVDDAPLLARLPSTPLARLPDAVAAAFTAIALREDENAPAHIER